MSVDARTRDEKEHGVGDVKDWRGEARAALEAFTKVADIGGAPLQQDELEIEYLNAPHRPPSRLPQGRMAVYGFWGDGEWLKIGKVGPKSNARYTSQHYNASSAPSTLAASLAKDERMAAVKGFNANSPGDWIKASTHRLNVLMPADKPRELLSLLEAFLHLRLRPRYEH